VELSRRRRLDGSIPALCVILADELSALVDARRDEDQIATTAAGGLTGVKPDG